MSFSFGKLEEKIFLYQLEKKSLVTLVQIAHKRETTCVLLLNRKGLFMERVCCNPALGLKVPELMSDKKQVQEKLWRQVKPRIGSISYSGDLSTGHLFCYETCFICFCLVS